MTNDAINKTWYFDGSRFFLKILRLLNLLEPDRTVLSMTKVLLWGTTIQSIFVLQNSTDVATIAGTLGINLAAMAKHEARRRSLVKEDEHDKHDLK